MGQTSDHGGALARSTAPMTRSTAPAKRATVPAKRTTGQVMRSGGQAMRITAPMTIAALMGPTTTAPLH